MSDEDIRRYTATELREMIARGEDRTDWNRVRAMTDEELEAIIADDPDEPEPGLQLRHRAVDGRSQEVALLDRNLVDFYRAQGPDWEARINDVLRAHQQAALKR